MTQRNTAEHLGKLVREHLALESLPDREDNLADDLGADALDRVELAIAVELEFGVEVSDDEVERLATYGDWLDLVEAKVGA